MSKCRAEFRLAFNLGVHQPAPYRTTLFSKIGYSPIAIPPMRWLEQNARTRLRMMDFGITAFISSLSTHLRVSREQNHHSGTRGCPGLYSPTSNAANILPPRIPCVCTSSSFVNIFSLLPCLRSLLVLCHLARLNDPFAKSSIELSLPPFL
jgi:hypothetical protein